MWQTIFVVLQVIIAIFMVVFVLLQRGQGATAGAAFGGGAPGGVSSTVFGSRGAGSFLSRTTALLAVGFFGISLGLAMIEAQRVTQAQNETGIGVMEGDVARPTAIPETGTPVAEEENEQSSSEEGEIQQ